MKRIFRVREWECIVLEKLRDGEEETFAAMKENRKAIYFLWELRRVRGSIAGSGHLLRSLTPPRSGGNSCRPPGPTFPPPFRDSETYSADTLCIFQCVAIDELIWGPRAPVYLVSTAERYPCFVIETLPSIGGKTHRERGNSGRRATIRMFEIVKIIFLRSYVYKIRNASSLQFAYNCKIASIN